MNLGFTVYRDCILETDVNHNKNLTLLWSLFIADAIVAPEYYTSVTKMSFWKIFTPLLGEKKIQPDYTPRLQARPTLLFDR